MASQELAAAGNFCRQLHEMCGLCGLEARNLRCESVGERGLQHGCCLLAAIAIAMSMCAQATPEITAHLFQGGCLCFTFPMTVYRSPRKESKPVAAVTFSLIQAAPGLATTYCVGLAIPCRLLSHCSCCAAVVAVIAAEWSPASDTAAVITRILYLSFVFASA